MAVMAEAAQSRSPYRVCNKLPLLTLPLMALGGAVIPSGTVGGDVRYVGGVAFLAGELAALPKVVLAATSTHLASPAITSLGLREAMQHGECVEEDQGSVRKVVEASGGVATSRLGRVNTESFCTIGGPMMLDSLSYLGEAPWMTIVGLMMDGDGSHDAFISKGWCPKPSSTCPQHLSTGSVAAQAQQCQTVGIVTMPPPSTMQYHRWWGCL